jgi:3-deoxy-D-manno-octulosonate 8-phosphate phosphatase KdsC-like HAD superfamily phosphatase
MKVTDKRETLLRYLEEKKISAEHVLFMGDDIPDYSVMKNGRTGVRASECRARDQVNSTLHFNL